MKILITSIVTLNGGDAAILLAEMELLKNVYGKNVRFVVSDKNATDSARYYPGIEFRPWLTSLMYKNKKSQSRCSITRWANKVAISLNNRLAPTRVYVAIMSYKYGLLRPLSRILASRKELSEIREFYDADLIVTTGGTYIIPEYGISSRFVEYFLIRKSRKPLIFFTQSIGFLRNTNERRQLKRILDYAQSILVRDPTSEAAVQSLIGSSNKVVQRSDAAFYFAKPERFSLRQASPERTLKVLVSVRDWEHFGGADVSEKMRLYRSAVGDLVNYCIRTKDAEVTFISTCQGIANYKDDSELAKEIVQGLDEDVQTRTTVEVKHFGVDELLNILPSFDFAVCTRMHMLILSLCSGVIPIPIAYGFKTADLAKNAGIEDLLLEIGDISGDRLIAAFDKAIAEEKAIAKKLRVAVDRLHRDCQVTEELLRVPRV